MDVNKDVENVEKIRQFEWFYWNHAVWREKLANLIAVKMCAQRWAHEVNCWKIQMILFKSRIKFFFLSKLKLKINFMIFEIFYECDFWRQRCRICLFWVLSGAHMYFVNITEMVDKKGQLSKKRSF